MCTEDGRAGRTEPAAQLVPKDLLGRDCQPPGECILLHDR